MNVDEALIRLGESTSEAVAGILQMFAGDAAQPGPVAIVSADADPLASVSTPAVAASVSYVDGVTGGSSPILAAAAANATSAVLGTPVEIAPPETQVLSSLEKALDGHEDAAHMTSGVFTVFGRPCRLVQLVPNAFVMRMTKALDELGAEYLGDQGPADDAEAIGLDESLRAIKVRVWAELGRSRMPIGKLIGTPAGAVVDLDRQADEPVDLFVNGMRFASGRLVVSEGGEWAVEIDALVGDVAATGERR